MHWMRRSSFCRERICGVRCQSTTARDGALRVRRSFEWKEKNEELVVCSCPSQTLALTCDVLLNPSDAACEPGERLYLRVGTRTLTAASSDAVAQGHLALNALHRYVLGLSVGDRVRPAGVLPSELPSLSKVSLEVEPLRASRASGVVPAFPCMAVSQSYLKQKLLVMFNDHVLSPGLKLAVPVVGRLDHSGADVTSLTLNTREAAKLPNGDLANEILVVHVVSLGCPASEIQGCDTTCSAGVLTQRPASTLRPPRGISRRQSVLPASQWTQGDRSV